MKIFTRIASILLGLIFVVFGINGLYTFIPVPEFSPFMKIMVDTNFIIAIKLLEITGGLLLIINRYARLALVIIGPIIINILLYHLFIDHRNMLIGFVNMVLYVVAVIPHWHFFKLIFKSKP